MSSGTTVPKFASFRPKAPAENGHKDIKVVKDSDNGSQGTSEYRERRDHRRHRHHHHRRHRSRSKEGSETRLIEPTPEVPAAADDAAGLFIEDRRGDPQNITYGSIHRYSVPAFHRFGAGSVLGARRELKIDRNEVNDKNIVLVDRREESHGSREKYIFARNEKKAPRLLRVVPNTEDPDEAATNVDFIQLRRSRTQRQDTHDAHSSDEDNQDYRSIEGRAKVESEPLDDDLEWTSNLDSTDTEPLRTVILDKAFRRKNVELSRKVDENPQEVEAWIALINHQDNILGLAEGRQVATSAEKRSTAEIKIHVYEKALQKAGNTVAKRERILLGLMAEGAKIWDYKILTEKWEQISKDNLDSILLWRQYLDFHQCSFSQFRQEEVRAIFIKRIKLLNEAVAKSAELGQQNNEEFEHLIYVTLRATLFLRGSGYSELAVAIWQALLELNFLDPDAPPSQHSRLELFKEFWDSEVPRVGEDGAKGWLKFSHAEDVPESKVDEDMPAEYLESDDIFEGWGFAENFKATSSRLPGRTLDDTAENDPYRVVLWSDIQDFIFDVSSSSSRRSISYLLLDAFLIFSKLPPMPASNHLPSHEWWIDSFMREEPINFSDAWVNSLFMDVPAEEAIKEGERREDLIKPFRWPFHYFAGSSESMFATAQWAKYFVPWQILYGDSSAGGPVLYDWIRNVLKSLSETNRISHLAEYYLAFEFCNEPQGVKKTVKSLLKKNPQSLKLYNAYAMIEWSMGNKEVLANVMSVTLEMSASLPDEERADHILLWKTWTWALLDDGDNPGALRCLFSVIDGVSGQMPTIDVSSTIILLKTARHFSAKRDYLISIGNLYHATIYVELLALVEYLTSNSGTEPSSDRQGDIASALSIFEKSSEEFIARNHGTSRSHELLLQSAARLLYHHGRSGPFRPKLIRAHLWRSLSLFPKNTILLSLYNENESRIRIGMERQSRIALRTLVLNEANDNVIGRLFAICYELRAGNLHSSHAAFEHAVTSPACKSNPGLWRLYVLFCATQRALNFKVKETYYRGIRACPWSKDLMMMAFTVINGFIGLEDQISIYRAMGEKELRMHVDIEDRLAELGAGGRRRIDSR